MEFCNHCTRKVDIRKQRIVIVHYFYIVTNTDSKCVLLTYIIRTQYMKKLNMTIGRYMRSIDARRMHEQIPSQKGWHHIIFTLSSRMRHGPNLRARLQAWCAPRQTYGHAWRRTRSHARGRPSKRLVPRMCGGRCRRLHLCSPTVLHCQGLCPPHSHGRQTLLFLGSHHHRRHP
jgi:hypothetical protein